MVWHTCLTEGCDYIQTKETVFYKKKVDTINFETYLQANKVYELERFIMGYLDKGVSE